MPNTLFHQAAKASLAAPLIAVLANIAWRAAHQGQDFNRGASLIVGSLAALLILGGLVLAIVALCGIPRYGKAGLLGRGIASLLINGLLVSIFVTNFVAARNRALSNRQAFNQINASTAELREDLQRSYEEDGMVTNTEAQLAAYRRQFDSAGQKVGGEQKQLMEAMSAYTAALQIATRRFSKAADALWENEVANFQTLTQREQIAARREVVQRFIAANTEFTGVATNQGVMIRSELEARHLPQAKVEKFVTEFDRGNNITRLKIVEIRACDDKTGSVLLSLLDLAESQWGKWHYDQATDYTIFENQKSGEEFAQLVEQLDATIKRQARLQGEILELQKQAATEPSK